MIYSVPIMKLSTLCKGSKKFGSALMMNMQSGSPRLKHCPIQLGVMHQPCHGYADGSRTVAIHLLQQPLSTTRESQQFRSLTSYLVKCNAAFRICKRRLLLQWQSCLRAYPFSKWKRKWSLYMVQIFLLQLPSQRYSLFGNTSGRTSHY